MFIRLLKLSCVLSLVALLSACGLSYEKFSHETKQSLAQNKAASFNTSIDDSDYLLINQDAGLFYFAQNQPRSSLNYFKKALDYYRQQDQSSSVTLRKALSFTFLSDTVIKYSGSPYERGLVHYYSALDYLLENDLDSAAVEFRAVENNQKYSTALHEKQIAASEGKVNSIMNKYNLQSQDINNALNQSKNIRASTRDKFLNGNLIYISGIVREINNDPNGAYINYKQSYDIYPNNPYILEDLYRLSMQFDLDYANNLLKQNPQLKNASFTNYNQQKHIYLIYEQGFVPQISNLKIAIIGLNNLTFSINLPVYKNINKTNNKVTLAMLDDNGNITNQNLASETSDIYLLARNKLSSDYPIIIARQLSKLVTQIVSQAALQKNGGQIGQIASLGLGLTSLFDSSDDRSWRLLPQTTQVAKLNTNKDNITLQIIINDKVISLPKIMLQNKKNVIIHVFDTGDTLYKKIIYSN